MANNVLLGALPIVEAQTDYTGGGIVSSPIDMVTLPTDSPAGSGFNVVATGPTGGGVNYLPGGPSGGGGDISMERLDIPVEFPTETKTDETPKPGMSKKNMMLIGIGAIVLGYLIFRKK